MSEKPHHIEPLWPQLTTISVIVLSSILAILGLVDIATYLFSLFAFVIGTVRLILRDKAPWKIRSILFDVLISYGLALGLLVTYISILML